MGRRLVKATQGVDDLRQIDGNMPFGHVCTPEEVAATVRFLVSDAAGYLSAQRIYVDGGAAGGP
jgi:NAD(P)-dependent dehydrogenase (short-subunit alcohol dehydrogenase family)